MLGAQRVIFAKDGALLVVLLGDLPQRAAGQIVVDQCGSDAFECGWKAIHQRNWRLHHLHLRHVRPGHNHRHRRGFVVERELAEDASGSQTLAVVGGIEHAGGIRQAVLVERAEHATDLLVEIGRGSVVRSSNSPHRLFTVPLVEAEEAAEVV